MKKSSRARRMARHHGKHKAVATLNLTSLMDIFTILLIFLLVNNNNAAKLPDNQDIQLPESIAQELPTEVLTIQVSPMDIIVAGQKIADTETVRNQEERTVAALVEELNFRASQGLAISPDEDREIMILADRSVPYSVIKKLMRSCMETPYTQVAFAVLKVAEEEEE
ncbi:RNA polymerase subunit sigma-70 [Alcanivorax sp. HI0083]|uniref:ExbD/TolR family protein n=1 Tax=unclassified Alcanivorax TaxID=2638842 RepID=UPI0007BA2493|nr:MULTISPECIES: biopolymer transporter ExbD [unclassified Alcanivorax]KZY35719.1 RNA polymerase subunit sigma-70 [Alcanivorax sp. HI0044]KZZ22636.1 RNA polymerase subunit sigma-70 [Alcanivorax sp. HI0083]PHR67897.1 MAG: biopolymer transporter ExbD [Alcanivorax sp.]